MLQITVVNDLLEQVLSTHYDRRRAHAIIASVLDWIDAEAREPDWWEIANIRDAIDFLHRGSTDLAIRLAEYARVPQSERLGQPRQSAQDSTASLRDRLNR